MAHSIELRVRGHEVEAVGDQTVVVEDTQRHFLLSVDFDDEWEGLAKRVTFANSGGGEPVGPIDYSDGMEVPAKALAYAGELTVGITGLGQDGTEVVRTRRMVYGVAVYPAGPDMGEEAVEEAEDILHQARAELEELSAKSDEFDAEFSEAQAARERAFSDSQAHRDEVFADGMKDLSGAIAGVERDAEAIAELAKTATADARSVQQSSIYAQTEANAASRAARTAENSASSASSSANAASSSAIRAEDARRRAEASVIDTTGYAERVEAAIASTGAATSAANDAAANAQNVASTVQGKLDRGELNGRDGKDYTLTPTDRTVIATEAAGKLQPIVSALDTRVTDLEQRPAGDGKVKDVTVAGTSVLGEDGVAAIPAANGSSTGVVKVDAYYGLSSNVEGRLYCYKATNSEVTGRTQQYRPIVPANLVHSVDSVLCSTAASERLTDAQQLAARDRIGAADALETSRAIENLRGVAVMEVTETIDGSAQVPAKAAKWADVVAVCGETVVWNQLVNRSATSSTTVNGITFTLNDDGSVTANGTATANADYDYMTTNVASRLSEGHYYLMSGVSGGSSTTYRMFFSYIGAIFNPSIVKPSPVGITNCTLRVYSGTTVDNLVFKPRLVDITMAFGAGNETANINDERIKRLLAMAEAHPECNPGELVSVGGVDVVSRGKNLVEFDSRFTVGGVTFSRDSYGNIVANGKTVGETSSANEAWKNFGFEVVAGETYTASFGNIPTSGAAVYIRNNNYSSYVAIPGAAKKYTFIAERTERCCIGVYMYNSSFDNVIFNIQVERGSTATPYVPYRGPIATSLTDATLRSAGSMRDEWTNGGIVRNVAVVDADTPGFENGPSVTNANGIAYITISITNDAWPVERSSEKCVSNIGVQNTLWSASDSDGFAYNGKTVFFRFKTDKTSGVTIADALARMRELNAVCYYALDAPVIEPHDPIDNTIETAGGGTLTFDGGSEVVAPKATVVYDMPTSN